MLTKERGGLIMLDVAYSSVLIELFYSAKLFEILVYALANRFFAARATT